VPYHLLISSEESNLIKVYKFRVGQILGFHLFRTCTEVSWSATSCCKELPKFQKEHVSPEDGGDIFHRNVDNHFQDHTVSQSIRPHST
jgi:hypothetical protein